MGHIPRECGRLSGGPSAIVAHENRYSPIEQAQVRPKSFSLFAGAIDELNYLIPKRFFKSSILAGSLRVLAKAISR